MNVGVKTFSGKSDGLANFAPLPTMHKEKSIDIIVVDDSKFVFKENKSVCMWYMYIS